MVVVVLVVVASTSVLVSEIDAIVVGFETVLLAVVVTDVKILFAIPTDSAIEITALFMHAF